MDNKDILIFLQSLRVCQNLLWWLMIQNSLLYATALIFYSDKRRVTNTVAVFYIFFLCDLSKIEPPLLLLSHFSRVRLCATPWTVATRLPRPWDSPGKNTGVGCHFLLQCMKVKSESEVAQSCLTLATPWTAAHQAPPSMGFSRQKYWSGVPLPSPEPPLGWINYLAHSKVKVRWGRNKENTTKENSRLERFGEKILLKVMKGFSSSPNPKNIA